MCLCLCVCKLACVCVYTLTIYASCVISVGFDTAWVLGKALGAVSAATSSAQHQRVTAEQLLGQPGPCEPLRSRISGGMGCQAEGALAEEQTEARLPFSCGLCMGPWHAGCSRGARAPLSGRKKGCHGGEGRGEGRKWVSA